MLLRLRHSKHICGFSYLKNSPSVLLLVLHIQLALALYVLLDIPAEYDPTTNKNIKLFTKGEEGLFCATLQHLHT